MDYRYAGADEWEIKRPEGWKLKDDFKPVFLNQYGYYELRKQNTAEERGRNFEESYFQEYAGHTYAKEYPPEELLSIRNMIEERAYVIEQNLSATGGLKEGKYTLLDIGCGEGFLLQYFHDKGVKVKGIDFGSYALSHFHPEMLAFFEQGDMHTLLPQMAQRGERYDVVNMDRVLDMVPDAGVSLETVKEVMTDESILVIKVANNYSYLQQMLMQSGELTQEYWLDDPDHTGYFNREGMINLLADHGFECIDFYADTFVELNLLNPLTNYYERPEAGKAAHQTSVRIGNLFHEISMERTVAIYRMLADMGFGREIIGVFRTK